MVNYHYYGDCDITNISWMFVLLIKTIKPVNMQKGKPCHSMGYLAGSHLHARMWSRGNCEMMKLMIDSSILRLFFSCIIDVVSLGGWTKVRSCGVGHEVPRLALRAFLVQGSYRYERWDTAGTSHRHIKSPQLDTLYLMISSPSNFWVWFLSLMFPLWLLIHPVYG
jgi:hypothetical protein